MRVATFNIRSGRGLDDRVDLDRIAHVMRATGAEIIGLQEVDRGLARTGNTDQAGELARLTGMWVAFHPTIERGEGDYGIALATSAECETRFDHLPRLGDEEPRGMVTATVEGLRVVNTHLAWQRAPRRPQIERLAELLRTIEEPTVVMGDLNTSGRHLRALVEGGMSHDPARRRTYFGGLGNPAAMVRRIRVHGTMSRHFDHVLAGGGARIERSWTIPTDASDHVPLAAVVRY